MVPYKLHGNLPRVASVAVAARSVGKLHRKALFQLAANVLPLLR